MSSRVEGHRVPYVGLALMKSVSAAQRDINAPVCLSSYPFRLKLDSFSARSIGDMAFKSTPFAPEMHPIILLCSPSQIPISPTRLLSPGVIDRTPQCRNKDVVPVLGDTKTTGEIFDSYGKERPSQQTRPSNSRPTFSRSAWRRTWFQRVIFRVALTVPPCILPLMPTGPPTG